MTASIFFYECQDLQAEDAALRLPLQGKSLKGDES